MINNHPITPPPELVQQWFEASVLEDEITYDEFNFANLAARWGADQELNECCKWLPKLPPWSADDLRKHRRPKPPSLAEEALAKTNSILDDPHRALLIEVREALELNRRALEQLVPTTPKPNIIPKPQFPPPRIIRDDFLP